MKKLFFTLFVALMATSLFTSCSDEKTDAEILADLANNTYEGKDASNGTYTLVLGASDFSLTEADATNWQGSFNVVNGQLILSITKMDGNAATGSHTLTVDGTSVFFKTFNTATKKYDGAEVELKQK